MTHRALFIGFATLAFIVPLAGSASAASTFEVSGWLPYWRAATSSADVLPHLDDLTEINPFVYTLSSTGSIVDNGSADAATWSTLIAAAKAKHVRVIPTIMTGNGDLLHDLLSNTSKRIALEDRIVKFVNDNGFDGIDIDFEGKHAADKDYFSTFLKGLYQRMGKKWVMCDIESRTPLDSRYYGTTVPPDAEVYANDFTAINKYCDRVRVMAYDQQGIDLALAAKAASSSEIYAPVADPAWVEKVITLMKKDIAPSKLVIGVPTYGYEYAVTAYANNQYVYDILWTFNPGYALPIANSLGITPARNSAGELYFTYVANTGSTTAPLSGTNNANLAAAAAAAYATQYNSHLGFRLVDWPDAQSLQSKIDLAKRLGVRGVAIFKLDGGEDQGIWNVLAGVAQSSTNASSQPTGGSASTGLAGAPSSSMTTLSRPLDLGSTGEDVRTVQKILNSDASTRVAASGAGSPGNESTYFGPATLAAVKKFQVKYGIAKSGDAGYGYVGPNTRAKLNAVLAAL
jgi:spore germination protein YaaH